jgi:uncharacterized protein (TIGR00725 family)
MRSEESAGRLVSIIGGRALNTSANAMILAELVGSELARRHFGIITGGESGIAEAASRGCVAAGGTSIAVLKGNCTQEAASWASWTIPTSTDLARSHPLLWAGIGAIAFEGRWGTLGEIALAVDMEKPIVIVGKPWMIDFELARSIGLAILDPAGSDAKRIVDVFLELSIQTPVETSVE